MGAETENEWPGEQDKGDLLLVPEDQDIPQQLLQLLSE